MHWSVGYKLVKNVFRFKKNIFLSFSVEKCLLSEMENIKLPLDFHKDWRNFAFIGAMIEIFDNSINASTRSGPNISGLIAAF